jgi:hypothetical protein
MKNFIQSGTLLRNTEEGVVDSLLTLRKGVEGENARRACGAHCEVIEVKLSAEEQ